jgi:hypothetical protein
VTLSPDSKSASRLSSAFALVEGKWGVSGAGSVRLTLIFFSVEWSLLALRFVLAKEGKITAYRVL